MNESTTARSLAAIAAIILSLSSIGAIVTLPPATSGAVASAMIA